MGEAEVPEAPVEDPEAPAEARQPDPAPEGASPGEPAPAGGPASSGSPPTGEPTGSPESHPAEEQEPVAARRRAEEPEQEPEPEPEGRPGRGGMRAADRARLNRITRERDDYLDQLRRTRADFENYRKRMVRQQTEHLERAAEGLVEKLLPVLDSFDAAIDHQQGYEQVQAALMSTLEKEGLERIQPLGKPFDPTEADAVAHEAGDDGPVVAEVLRSGYRWKGRVVRPAMVRVRG